MLDFDLTEEQRLLEQSVREWAAREVAPKIRELDRAHKFDRGILPPTGFLEQPDPACAVRHVARVAERVDKPRAVMSNSFAFGGSNVVLVAERP